MTDHTIPPPDDEFMEHERAIGHAVLLGYARKQSAMTAKIRQAAEQPETTHQGPHPDHGGLTTHVGTRENCSGPDCGPRDPEDEIRDAVLDLEALHTAANGTSWQVAREQDTHPEGDGAHHVIGIEPTDGDAYTVVFQDLDIAEEDAAYIAAMDPETGYLLTKLLHEIAEDCGPKLDNRQAIHEAARNLAHKINNRPA
ncbi:hypothetical protein ACFWZZ_00505 [[Kitasatospora] papulosa]|uniref:hypothetical protein n=1 Tax=Streptomyces TaxID=1883 RepID=UPI003324A210